LEPLAWEKDVVEMVAGTALHRTTIRQTDQLNDPKSV
jgi:hypothetical protein